MRLNGYRMVWWSWLEAWFFTLRARLLGPNDFTNFECLNMTVEHVLSEMRFYLSPYVMVILLHFTLEFMISRPHMCPSIARSRQ